MARQEMRKYIAWNVGGSAEDKGLDGVYMVVTGGKRGRKLLVVAETIKRSPDECTDNDEGLTWRPR